MARQLAQEDFQRWQRGIDQSSEDAAWDQYDCDIQEAVYAFNMHLQSISYYMPLDWKLIKAMTWVESGANSIDWKKNPMQIGKFNDPGLGDLLAPDKGGEIILPSNLRAGLNAYSVRTDPVQSIRAGTGYLLMRAAKFDFVHRLNVRDTNVYDYIVKPGDSLDRIARLQGTTVDVLRDKNPGVGILKPGQHLKYRKASREKAVVGWRLVDISSIPALYNGGGDNMYERKLAYAMAALFKKKVLSCRT